VPTDPLRAEALAAAQAYDTLPRGEMQVPGDQVGMGWRARSCDVKAVVQRVAQGRVTVGGEVIGQIGPGLVVLLGIERGDGDSEAQWMANKIANLRVFADDEGKFNRSLLDVAGQILLISQFTVCGDARKGRRPSFTSAAPPEVAEPLLERVAELLAQQGVPVECGQFQAHMMVEIHNDGPVTIILEKPPSNA
jgi:D-tyrosyl-tRNA(Tyr) deacylase